jgi:hypothetical protein
MGEATLQVVKAQSLQSQATNEADGTVSCVGCIAYVHTDRFTCRELRLSGLCRVALWRCLHIDEPRPQEIGWLSEGTNVWFVPLEVEGERDVQVHR